MEGGHYFYLVIYCGVYTYSISWDGFQTWVISLLSAHCHLSTFNTVEQTSGNRGKEIDASDVASFLLSKPDCSSLSDNEYIYISI